LNVYETKAEENERMLRPLPTERSAWIIVWRNGVKCGRSRKAVKMATAGGYKNICQQTFCRQKRLRPGGGSLN
jgi:hypothetical protein